MYGFPTGTVNKSTFSPVPATVDEFVCTSTYPKSGYAAALLPYGSLLSFTNSVPFTVTCLSASVSNLCNG